MEEDKRESCKIMSMIPPCFFCSNPAEYFGEVVEVDGVMKAIEVCKNHFKFQEASS